MENDLQLSDIFTIDMQRIYFIEETTWHLKKCNLPNQDDDRAMSLGWEDTSFL